MTVNLRTQLPGHLDDDVVVPDPQGAIWKNLNRDVAIADVPSDPGGFGEFAATQVRDRFRCCDDPHVPAVFQHQAIAFAKAHGLGKVQEERIPFVGDEPNPAAVAAVIIQGDRGTLPFGRPLRLPRRRWLRAPASE